MELRYRGRVMTPTDVDTIRTLIATHPEWSRRGLSRALCETWHWTQPNGTPCDAICRGLRKAGRGGRPVQRAITTGAGS